MWPSQTTWRNFAFVLLQSDFPLFFLNSIIVSLGTAVLVTLFAAAAGYAFSRFRFRGKLAVVLLLLLTQMFPLVMLIAPIYRMMAPLGLTDNLARPDHRLHRLQHAVRDLPDAVLLRWHPAGPRGGGDDRRLHALAGAAPGIVLPLTLPGMGATLGFVFTAAWSELLFALMLINSEGKKTFPVGLLTFVSKFSVDWGQMMAAAVLALIPACRFFFFIQRYLVQGLTAGAVKG